MLQDRGFWAHLWYATRTLDSEAWPHSWKTILFLVGTAIGGYVGLFILRCPLFDLAVLMSMVDLSAFGGGFASLPLMFHEIVDVRAWMDGPTFLNGIVLGQVAPGPIVITATFVGFLLHGPFGGLIAAIGVFLPSFVLVIAIAPYFSRMLASQRFTMAVGGILCSFVGLLLTVTVRFALNVSWDVGTTLLACAAFVVLILKADILWVVLAGAIISLVLLKGGGANDHTLAYEKRFRARNQIEVSFPFGFRHQDDGWIGGVGDIGLGFKRVLFSSLRNGSILSVQGEVILPTGDRARDFGKGITVFEGFGTYGQILPGRSFLQLQAGVELPLSHSCARRMLGEAVSLGPVKSLRYQAY